MFCVCLTVLVIGYCIQYEIGNLAKAVDRLGRRGDK